MDKSGEAFDIAIVGAGMAGSIVAAECIRAGLRTLVLEAGLPPAAQPAKPASLARKLKRSFFSHASGKAGRWPDDILFRGDTTEKYRIAKPFLGIGRGGSGRIYGAALGRARPDDFAQSWDARTWCEGADEALPNAWPIKYADLEREYREAEELLEVVGTPDPLDPNDDSTLRHPPPLSPARDRIVEVLRANGRHPYRLHVGIRYRPGCWECQGEDCPRDCKSHGFNRALEPLLDGAGLVDLREGESVVALDRLSDGTLQLKVRDVTGGERTLVAGKVILAAGALNTPRLLQASGNLWDGDIPQLIGAGLMFHASEIFAVSGFAKDTLWGPRKVLAFRDHYRCDGVPLAECQSLGFQAHPSIVAQHLQRRALEMGMPLHDALMLALRIPASIAARRFSNSELFTAALEDLPYPDNRVDTVRKNGVDRIAITYRVPEEMRLRSRRFRELAEQAFAPLRTDFFNRPGSPNFGHPMGTCRMGADPQYSVVDRNCQLWEQEGIYVADASVMPSSLGVNPALTVAANALRIARSITGQTEQASRHHVLAD